VTAIAGTEVAGITGQAQWYAIRYYKYLPRTANSSSIYDKLVVYLKRGGGE
jgi:hypothetical protein